jgi:hypothetical protein
MPDNRDTKQAARRPPKNRRAKVAAPALHLVDLARSQFGPENGIDLVLPARAPARPVEFEVNGRRRRPVSKEA